MPRRLSAACLGKQASQSAPQPSDLGCAPPRDFSQRFARRTQEQRDYSLLRATPKGLKGAAKRVSWLLNVSQVSLSFALLLVARRSRFARNCVAVPSRPSSECVCACALVLCLPACLPTCLALPLYLSLPSFSTCWSLVARAPLQSNGRSRVKSKVQR